MKNGKTDLNDIIMGESEEYKDLPTAEELLINSNEPWPETDLKETMHGLHIAGVENIDIPRPPVEPFDEDKTPYDKVAVKRNMTQDGMRVSSNELNTPLKTEIEENADGLNIKGVEFFDIARPPVEPFDKVDVRYDRKSVKRKEIARSFVEIMSRIDAEEEEIDVTEVIHEFEDNQEERLNLFMMELKKNITKQQFHSEDRLRVIEQSKRIKEMSDYVIQSIIKTIQNDQKHVVIDVQIEDSGEIVCRVLDEPKLP